MSRQWARLIACVQVPLVVLAVMASRSEPSLELLVTKPVVCSV